MKKFLVYTLTMVVSIGLLTSCNSKEPLSTNNNETISSNENSEEKLDSDVDSNSEEDQNADTDNETVGAKRIGSELYGFWDVPDDWIQFQDLSGAEEVLQYSDSLGIHITTSRYFEDSDLTALDVANYYYSQMEQDGAVDVTGATVSLDERESLQVYGYYPNEDVMWIVWAFAVDGEEDIYHMVSVEGPSGSISEVFERMENSYSYVE